MTSMTKLQLHTNMISDISSLAGMTELTTLSLRENKISDISALTGMTKMTELILYSNQISDISALAAMAELTDLRLNNNQISNISALTLLGMPKMTKLHLSDNQISNISALSGMTKLSVLYLHNNQISDISALAGKTDLTILFLANNQISDISALLGMTNMVQLRLQNNLVSVISALGGMNELTDLWLNNNQISNISALAGMTKMATLYLSVNQISDISALSGMTELADLRLWGNQVSDISALSGLTKLTYLQLYSNQISNISALSGMTEMTELYLGSNQISDISALAAMTRLSVLYLNDNQISDINALSGLTSLEDLRLWNNQVSDISALIHLKNLTYLNLGKNLLNTSAYCNDLSVIQENNPGIEMYYDPSDDFDVDGIQNEIDTSSCFYSMDFTDEPVGTTNGTILTRGDQVLTITDEANPEGVTISAGDSGGSIPAEISVCRGEAILHFAFIPGKVEFNVKCGSVLIDVVSGTVETTFVADDGTTATAALDEGNAVTFQPEEKTFETPNTNVDTVVILVEGTEVSVEPGETALAVEIDIKPGSESNSINPGADGVVPVAILTTADFDASTVDPVTVTLAGASVNIAGQSGRLQAELEDIDNDGDLDMVLQITNELNLQIGTTVAYLEGKTFDGIAIHGQDSVNIVP
jgi:internalin A